MNHAYEVGFLLKSSLLWLLLHPRMHTLPYGFLILALLIISLRTLQIWQSIMNTMDRIKLYGAGLSISHIGSNRFPHGSSSFAMSNILHCPSIATNLLSVYQFTRDNNCYFIFFSNCFYVKDLKTGRTLYRGKSKHGLYLFHIHAQISPNQGVHLRLLVFMLALQSGILS